MEYQAGCTGGTHLQPAKLQNLKWLTESGKGSNPSLLDALNKFCQCSNQGPYLGTWVCNTDLLSKRGPY